MNNETMMTLAAIDNSLSHVIELIREAELEPWRETEILLELARINNQSSKLARRAQ